MTVILNSYVWLGCITLVLLAQVPFCVSSGGYQPPLWLPTKNTSTSEVSVNDCGICDAEQCPIVSAQSCPGKVVPDDCECCNVCIYARELQKSIDSTDEAAGQEGAIETVGMAPTESLEESCSHVHCSRSEMCVLNIQGIPVCRCPSLFWCRRSPRQDICGLNGKTYRSRCYHKHEECTTNTKIRIAHKGPCVGSNGDDILPEIPADLIPSRRQTERKLRKEAEREERKESRRHERLRTQPTNTSIQRTDKPRRKQKYQANLDTSRSPAAGRSQTRKEQRQQQRERRIQEGIKGRQSGKDRQDVKQRSQSREDRHENNRNQRKRKNRRHRGESDRGIHRRVSGKRKEQGM